MINLKTGKNDVKLASAFFKESEPFLFTFIDPDTNELKQKYVDTLAELILLNKKIKKTTKDLIKK